ncbi:MAG TPA: hypothetical protein VHU62_11115 [Mycobacterium sp.]|nr:hypothetical protein [Mycobacterium sp.]
MSTTTDGKCRESFQRLFALTGTYGGRPSAWDAVDRWSARVGGAGSQRFKR